MTQTNYLWFLIVVIGFSFTACSQQKKTNMTKPNKEEKSSQNKTKVVSYPIVTKSFVNKVGESSEFKEYYLQASIQDYFIKFCESNITRKDLEAYLNSQTGLIKTAKLEVEYREGLWDVCDGNINQQSRTGKYVIIHRIIN